MYNLSLPKLSANYYGLPTTVQLWAAHELMLSVQCLRYCTVPGYCVFVRLNSIFWDRSPLPGTDFYWQPPKQAVRTLLECILIIPNIWTTGKVMFSEAGVILVTGGLPFPSMHN